MTLVKEVLDINWSEPFEINTTEDEIGQEYITCLQKCFGHSNFREMQWKVIASILNDRRDNCVIMATGYGKSLCYQFPSVFLNTITIVVSPLISLMQDQVLAMSVNNLGACFLGSAQENRETVYEVIDRQYNIVYVTPEYITSELGEFLLNRIREYLTLIAIDEAHCISKWGHDFRSAYRKLNRLRNLCPAVPILAMTATATPHVRDDIIQSLKLHNAQIISTGFDRPNLEFAVRHKSNVWADIGPHIARIKIGSVIVYCISRRITEEVASAIQANGYVCGVYHAGLSLTQRKKAHDDFIHDRIRVICATIAFGMGINKPDVRLVVHYGVAKDVESYYQEVGRAGRDGLPSKCLMFYEKKDWTLRSMIENKSNRVETLEHKEKLMQVMRQYISSNVCRRRFILSYFGENYDKLETRLNCCDNCKRPGSTQNLFNSYEGLCEDGLLDITHESLKVLTLVQHYNGSFGFNKIVLILRGSKSKSLPEQCLIHPLYGSLKIKPIKWLEAVGNYLHNSSMLVTAQQKSSWSRSYPTCVITPKGIEQLNTGSPVRIIPGEEFIRLLKIKVKSLPKILTAKPADNQLSISNGTLTMAIKTVLPKSEAPPLDNIYRPLLRARTKLASLYGIMPYLVASTKALQQLATHQPTSMNEFRQLELDGYSEDKKERFGQVFLKVIRDFHAKTGKSVQKEALSMSNVIRKNDSNDRPSTSLNHLVSAKRDDNHLSEWPKETETKHTKSDIKTELSQNPREEDDTISNTQDSVKVIESTPPPLIEISDSDTESENHDKWENGIRDSELLQVGYGFDEFNQDSCSDSDSDELDLFIAALNSDRLCPKQLDKRTENYENKEPIPYAIKEEQKVSSNCSRNKLPDIAFNQCSTNVDADASKNQQTRHENNVLSNDLSPNEVDSDLDMFDEYWDTDVNDLDLTQISEKAEQEIQGTSANIPPRRENNNLTKKIPTHNPARPLVNSSVLKAKNEKEESDLDLFLAEVKLDLNRNYHIKETATRHTNDRTRKAEDKVRVIQKTSNAFEYEDDSNSESDNEPKIVTSPKKRALPSWMQLTNKRRR